MDLSQEHLERFVLLKQIQESLKSQGARYITKHHFFVLHRVDICAVLRLAIQSTENRLRTELALPIFLRFLSSLEIASLKRHYQLVTEQLFVPTHTFQ